MNEPIRLAIEKGGYESWWTNKPFRIYKNYLTVDTPFEVPPTTDILFAELTQSPVFWQALGKALGWGVMGASRLIEPIQVVNGRAEVGSQPEWQYRAHEYLDLVLTGGDTEKFWKELLATVN